MWAPPGRRGNTGLFRIYLKAHHFRRALRMECAFERHRMRYPGALYSIPWTLRNHLPTEVILL